jgi:FtsP/CotA-like multicopper oxidase with cupredoxin domain
MAKSKITRRRLLVAAAPFAAAPVLVKYGLDGSSDAAGDSMASHEGHAAMGHAAMGHAAMIGEGAPAVGGAHDLDALLYPPPALPYEPGRVREYTLTAIDKDIEVAPGVFFPAWTCSGTVPGPVLRATEGDLLRVRLVNGSSHPHTIHFHGIHPANIDSVFEVVPSGGEFMYEFEARPAALQL